MKIPTAISAFDAVEQTRRLLMPVVAVLVLGSFWACRQEASLPDPSSETYREAVSAFYTGLAAMQVGEGQMAEQELAQVTELVPQEPAAWANLGLLALRRNDFTRATQYLEHARTLAPESSQIQYLSGLLANAQGQFDEGAAYFRRALELDPHNPKVLYALVQLAERTGGEDSEAKVRRLLDTLATVVPNNLAVRLEQARMAAGQGDRAGLQEVLERLEEHADTWPPEAREQFQRVQAAAASELNQAATQIVFLQNALKPLASYRADLAAVQVPPEQAGMLVTNFLRLPTPGSQPATPDDSLTFVSEPLPVGSTTGPWKWMGTLLLDSEMPPVVVQADGQHVWIDTSDTLSIPGGPPAPSGIAGLDVNYDFEVDLVLVGAGGLRLFQQDPSNGFVDVTAQMNLPASLVQASYTGAWAADLDMEGDMDLVLATPAGPSLVLRNNGDGTFSPWSLFDDVAGLRDFAWADLDADGDPDAVMVDASGNLHVFENRRSGSFQPFSAFQPTGSVLAVELADVNSDGTIDLVLLQTDGTLQGLSHTDGAWHATEIDVWVDLPAGHEPGTIELFAADLDNNGGVDLLAATPSGAQVWLSNQEHTFYPLNTPVDAHIFEVADLVGEGRLDLIGLSADGQPVRLVNQGTRRYHARSIRPRAAMAVGDQRINSFGIGGEIEIRSGLLFQKQPITGPIVHFGLGDYVSAHVARIIWPNGDVQAEFDLESDQTVLTRQRLKGSCPWLFTYDGQQMQFVTDFLWRSPLGLAINAQETAGIMTTEDWVKIRGDQLVPRDGRYDIRITAELWETHFFDHVSLLVVDHPDTTDIFVDERFAFPPPPLAVHATTPPRPVLHAWDDQGRDVTNLVQARDARYLGGFVLGPYQGVAQDHYVEIELGEDAPQDGPLVLVASGWVRPTDSSINVALSQGDHAAPNGLRVEVPDGRGGWVVARDGLGFPSGKLKTVLIDLEDLFQPGTNRRLRLRTNLEVYWDALAWAVPLPQTTDLHTQHLRPESAQLRYRGFSTVTEANRASPELPHYDELSGTTQVWRDLIGYYTRFGDVRELLAAVDDRYVIMNAGDELVFTFAVPPPPAEGWTRDFVLIGDGWVKDGDYNTNFSKTVLPLPSHDRPAYTTPPGRLQDDPIYRRYPDDWQTYHTRYVTPESFHQALQIDKR